ncbi:MAG: hypothetical protein MRY21_03100 [Simkaniaceae bacterium]|nr:hypothetical protein [Simkaniaceae bacterium]
MLKSIEIQLERHEAPSPSSIDRRVQLTALSKLSKDLVAIPDSSLSPQNIEVKIDLLERIDRALQSSPIRPSSPVSFREVFEKTLGDEVDWFPDAGEWRARIWAAQLYGPDALTILKKEGVHSEVNVDKRGVEISAIGVDSAVFDRDGERFVMDSSSGDAQREYASMLVSSFEEGVPIVFIRSPHS